MIHELSVGGAFVFTPTLLGDDRGVFLEWFRTEELSESVGHSLELQQANMSVSAAGALRGIHFADVPPGQAKYVTCPKGAVLDVVVDIRIGSPTFGEWDSVVLDDISRRCIYLSEGLGHSFLSLEDGSTVMYLCSSGYSPEREHGIHPMDSEIGIDWPKTGRNGEPLDFEISAKDSEAPSLSDAVKSGLLPKFDEVTAYVESLTKF